MWSRALWYRGLWYPAPAIKVLIYYVPALSKEMMPQGTQAKHAMWKLAGALVRLWVAAAPSSAGMGESASAPEEAQAEGLSGLLPGSMDVDEECSRWLGAFVCRGTSGA